MILHDETVNRTTDGKGRIDRLSLQEIQTLNAGNGEIIPTLEEALEAVAGRAGLLLELKVHGMAQQAVKTVQPPTVSSMHTTGQACSRASIRQTIRVTSNTDSL